MDYLGHNEFGVNHKAWNLPINFENLNDINYWLEQWFLFYQNIFEKYQSRSNCHFIIYENLTNLDYVSLLIEKINLKNFKKLNLNYFKNSNKKEIDVKFNKNLLSCTKNIYKKFINN